MTQEEKDKAFAALNEQMASSFVHRRLSPREDYDDEAGAAVAHSKRIYDTCADLIGSPAWDVIRNTAAEIIQTYAAEPPRTVDGQIAWMTFGTAADAINKLIAGIEAAGAQGDTTHNHVKEVTINV